MSDPEKHHYLPVFYLRRWKGNDDRICRFNWPRGDEVLAKRVVPKGTAYEEHLYSHRPSDGSPDPQMEKDFMRPLDSEAALALGHLEDKRPESKWEGRSRSAWSRFVWSLSLRTPSEVEQLKSSVKEDWDAKLATLKARYENQHDIDGLANLNNYLLNDGADEEDRFALSMARTLMDHTEICQMINNMHWRVLDFENSGIPLLTSDRPVWMTDTLTEEDAFISMPIGPTCLFVATKSPRTLRRLVAQNRRQQAKVINKITVQHAVKFVYGIDSEMLKFIQKHFATKRHSTHLERLAVMQNHKIISPKSPVKKLK